MKLLRHQLCHLPRNNSPLSQHSPDELDCFHYWQRQKYPFVCTRQPLGLNDSQVQVAIPYYNPVTKKKIRYSFLISKAGLLIDELPTLNDVFPTFDKRWRHIRVYGSFCWQYVTRETYVQSDSDLDILIPYLNQTLDSIDMAIRDIKFKSKLTVDGEVRFPTFGDCAIHELLNYKSQTILFKSTYSVALVPREIVYANFPALFY